MPCSNAVSWQRCRSIQHRQQNRFNHRGVPVDVSIQTFDHELCCVRWPQRSLCRRTNSVKCLPRLRRRIILDQTINNTFDQFVRQSAVSRRPRPRCLMAFLPIQEPDCPRIRLLDSQWRRRAPVAGMVPGARRVCLTCRRTSICVAPGICLPVIAPTAGLWR